MVLYFVETWEACLPLGSHTGPVDDVNFSYLVDIRMRTRPDAFNVAQSIPDRLLGE